MGAKRMRNGMKKKGISKMWQVAMGRLGRRPTASRNHTLSKSPGGERHYSEDVIVVDAIEEAGREPAYSA